MVQVSVEEVDVEYNESEEDGDQGKKKKKKKGAEGRKHWWQRGPRGKNQRRL